MVVDTELSSMSHRGKNDTDRRFRDESSNLYHKVVGGRVISILTGRQILVLSPPDRPNLPRPSNTDESLAHIETVLREASAVGQEARKRLGETASERLLELRIPDDISVISELVGVPR